MQMHQGRITLDKDTAPDERTDAPEDNTELVDTERCGRGCHALRVAQYSVPLKGSPRYLALSLMSLTTWYRPTILRRSCSASRKLCTRCLPSGIPRST